MSRFASMLVCSSMGLVLGAGISLAATSPWFSEINSAQRSLQEAMVHLQAANISYPFGGPNNPQIRKAMAYVELARAELPGGPKPSN
jgi:hypothetical protein